jgi:hypothetical protein
MKLPWFKRTALFFIPVSIIGWVIFFSGIIDLVYTFIAIGNRSHSVSDTLISFSFNLFLVFCLYSLIAFAACRKVINKNR